MKKKAPKRVSLNQYVQIKSDQVINEDQQAEAPNKNTVRSLHSIKFINQFFKQYMQTNKKPSFMKTHNLLLAEKDNQLEEEQSQKKKDKVIFQFSINQIMPVCITRMGIRNYDNMENQDVLLQDQIPNKCKVFAIFDGHGTHGRLMALSAKNIFQNLFLKYSEEIKNENPLFPIETIVRKVIQKTNSYLLHYKAEQAQFSGTTAVIAVITSINLYVFNIGNSRAVLGKYYSQIDALKPFQVTHDHTLERFDERLRIKEAGASIQPYKNDMGMQMGPDRIWAQNQKYPGITVTRTLGLSCAYKLGVTPQPQTFIFKANSHFRFLILASDGLWTVKTNEQVLSMLQKSVPQSLTAHTNALIFEAIQKWKKKEELMDDITIIVIPLQEE